MPRTAPHRAPADLEAALDALGIELWRSTDTEVTAFCPGHLKRVGREERSASWSVNRDSGYHNCFSCGFKGTFLELVMFKLFPNDAFRAARWMRAFGVNLAKARDLVPFEELGLEEDKQTLVPETRLAMYDEVPDWALEARSISRESCSHYGVRWDAKHESWIIPVRTIDGALAGWQEKWQKRRRFINDPQDMLKSQCLFGFDVFPAAEPAVLLESPLDVLRLHTAGWEGGLSSYGAAVSTKQMQIIEAVTDELILALDNDKDGMLHTAELVVGKWEGGKVVSSRWTGRLHLRVFNYGSSDAKDIGDMDDVLIAYGLETSQYSTIVKKDLEHLVGVHRKSQAVSGSPRRADGRPRPGAADGRRRNGQDPHDGRRRRGVA